MSERSYSHKSDGRQSSAGHSVHSATSGRANSLTGYGLNTPMEPPGLAPGLFILGSVPAIIRCWLNTDFKHDTLLYAAICSGSYASHLNVRLVEQLGFQDGITKDDDGTRKIKLPVYLPEAIPVSASSRSSSPAPQLPSLSVEFRVVDRHQESDEKAMHIFLGSDVLRAHHADILFSSSQLTLYDDDRSKLRIPLVRPEDERTFKSLFTTSGSPSSRKRQALADNEASAPPESDAMGEDSVPTSIAEHTAATSAKINGAPPTTSSEDGSAGRRSLEQRPILGLATGRLDSTDGPAESSPANAAPRSGTSPAIWSNWRRDAEKPGSTDWANVGKDPSSTYQRRDTGIKVLKPMKASSRALSSGIPQSSSPASAGQSRFFDEGKRRTGAVGGGELGEPQLSRSVSGERAKESVPPLAKTRSANPVGGASAFAWLNNGGTK